MRLISKPQTYKTGETIHAGDRVRHAGVPGMIVFVNDTGEYLKGFSDHWLHLGSGFMFRQDTRKGGLFFMETADEDLKFERRASE